MDNFCFTHATRKLLLCTTTLAVSLAPIAHVHAEQPIHAINLNDVNTALKFEKLIEKANKYFKANDSKKLLEVMLDIKHETEACTGQKIDINKSLEKVENEIKAKGGKISKSEMKALKKIIKDSEKKHNHKAFYMTAAFESGCDYNIESMNIEWDYLCKLAGKSKEKEEEEIILPVRVTVGVTMALCGVFITILPFPPCKTWGPQLVVAGVGLAIEGGCGKVEEDRKEEKNKNKSVVYNELQTNHNL